MKISFLVDSITTKSGARAPLKIAEGLAKLGEEITIYAYDNPIDTLVLESLKKLKIKVVLISGGRRVLKFFTSGKLLQEMKKNDCDLIACHSSFPFYFAAKKLNIPIIYTYYGTQLTAFDSKMAKELGLSPGALVRLKMKLADQTILFLERLRLRSANRVIGISKSTVSEARLLYGREIDRIYLGADLEQPGEIKTPKNDKDILLLSVSRITPYKGFHLVLAAFNNLKNKYPNTKLVMVGTKQDDLYLNYLKKHLDGRSEIFLNLDEATLLGYYQNCDIYLSGTSWEGFGLPFLEAENFGKPVLGFNNTSLPEVVGDGKSGFLVADQKEFETRLDLLLSNKDLRIKMGRNAKLFAGQFTWEKTAQDYQKYFKNYLSEVK